MNARNVITITKRELSAYFNSAVAYIFMIVFVVMTVGLYISEFFMVGNADMRALFNSLPIILCAFLPALTMRLWAEERRGNTLELLLTFPMSTHELVIGKYVASLLFYLFALLLTLPIPIMLLFLGRPDLGPIIGSYIGCLLYGSFFIALGIFVSGICRDQIVAFISTLVICFLFVFVGTEFFATFIDGWFPRLGFGTFLKISFGILPHYASFAKGVIDLSDFLYFILGTVIFLTLNGFWLEGRLRPKAKTIFTSAVIVCFAIFLAFNWLIGDMMIARADLTEQKIYTISDTTKKILHGLKVPALVKFYVSPKEKMPTQLKSLEQDVIDKLQEFKLASGGKFDFKIFHLEAANLEGVVRSRDSKQENLEAQAFKKGVEPFRVQSVEEDQVGVRLIYSALTVAYKEKPEEVIPQVIPSSINELEYLLMSKIYRMTLAAIPQIAIVAPYQNRSMDPMMASVLSQLGGGKIPEQYQEDDYRTIPAALDYSGYKYSRIGLSKKEPIPENTKTLVVIEPKSLNERQKYEINRFLYQGGSLLLGVQNYNFEYQPTGRSGIRIQGTPENPAVNDLLKPWGVEVDDSVLLDEQSEMITVGGAKMGPFAVSIPVKTPLQIIIAQDGMNDRVSITSNLSPLFYLWGSALKLDNVKLKSLRLKSDILLHTTKNSWEIPFGSGILSTKDLAIGRFNFTGPYPVAVLMSGQFPNNFMARRTLPLWPEEMASSEASDKDLEKKATPAPELTPKPGKLIAVGSSMIFKENLMSGGGGHLNFFLNAIDALSLDEDLTKIRSKQEISRQIRRVSKPENIFWRFSTLFLIPMLVLTFGSLRLFVRRKVKQDYLIQLSRTL